MKSTVLAVVGVSGVGKTTFLRRAAEVIAFQHLSAGTLIAQARASTERQRDQLRLAAVVENQRMLIAGFDLMRDRRARYVVLDGHVVIHGVDGLQRISSDVFRCLGIGGLIHLTADPADILSNREQDKSRERPAISLDEIHIHQATSIATACEIANDLSVPCRILGPDQQTEFCDFAAEVGRGLSNRP